MTNEEEQNANAARVTEFLDAVSLGDDIEARYAAIQAEFRALLIDIETEKRVYLQTREGRHNG
jgi:hypothetical protein